MYYWTWVNCKHARTELESSRAYRSLSQVCSKEPCNVIVEGGCCRNGDVVLGLSSVLFSEPKNTSTKYIMGNRNFQAIFVTTVVNTIIVSPVLYSILLSSSFCSPVPYVFKDISSTS